MHTRNYTQIHIPHDRLSAAKEEMTESELFISTVTFSSTGADFLRWYVETAEGRGGTEFTISCAQMLRSNICRAMQLIFACVDYTKIKQRNVSLALTGSGHGASGGEAGGNRVCIQDNDGNVSAALVGSHQVSHSMRTA